VQSPLKEEDKRIARERKMRKKKKKTMRNDNPNLEDITTGKRRRKDEKK